MTGAAQFVPRRLDAGAAGFDAALSALLEWDLRASSDVNRIAGEIIERIRSDGSRALLELTAELDGVRADSVDGLSLGPEDFARAFAGLADDASAALTLAAERIRAYHLHQRQSDWEFEDALGNRLGQRITPLDRVGLYVPGGQAAYPSTLLMTAIPARVAGVPELIVTVPTPNGVCSELVLAAAHLGGVDRLYRVGGAQAIAALAFGSAGIPRVDKIVGPGGAFVAAAKRQLYGMVGIDAIAGPSEILIIADGTADPRWLALDMFSQAEHDAAAQAILVCTDASYLERVLTDMSALLPDMARRDVITASLNARAAFVLVDSLDTAAQVANRVAPEHLQLAIAEPRALLPALRHAGAIFLGACSAEVLGDYAAGPSHVLPTFGTARFSSPLGVYDFCKRSSIIELSVAGADALARVSAVIAEGEGLSAHAMAARVRIRGYDQNSARDDAIGGAGGHPLSD